MRRLFILTTLCSLCLGIIMPSAVLADRSAADVDEPRFAEIPDACSYLTEPAALGLLRAEQVRPGAANSHLPTFWSNCEYSSRKPGGRKTGFSFKFMVFDMFDVELLDPMQLEFNASFATGGMPLVDRIDDLGKKSLVFEQRNRTTLLVITGIQGPLDGAQRPSEFIATYYLEDPDTPHAVKLEKLLAHARRHLEEWLD